LDLGSDALCKLASIGSHRPTTSTKPVYGVLFALMFVASMGLSHAQTAKAFSFVALGDLPYGPPESAYAPYLRLIERINQAGAAFSVHLGDIKSGASECSDQLFTDQLAHFQRFTGAVVYTPGDNEWTDCHRASNGAYNPLERLAAIRHLFFVPGRSLGAAPRQLENQSNLMPPYALYVENQRWRFEDVLFATLHIVGSNNNLEARDQAAAREFFERDAANVAWIKDSFEQAAKEQARAIVFAFHADVFDSRSPWEDFPGWSGFRRTISETLLPLASKWAKPVLVVHGDSHKFRIDQPFVLAEKPLKNVTRLIVPGASDVRAVRVLITPETGFLFELISP